MFSVTICTSHGFGCSGGACGPQVAPSDASAVTTSEAAASLGARDRSARGTTIRGVAMLYAVRPGVGQVPVRGPVVFAYHPCDWNRRTHAIPPARASRAI